MCVFMLIYVYRVIYHAQFIENEMNLIEDK